jgi:hypothetical protein
VQQGSSQYVCNRAAVSMCMDPEQNHHTLSTTHSLPPHPLYHHTHSLPPHPLSTTTPTLYHHTLSLPPHPLSTTTPTLYHHTNSLPPHQLSPGSARDLLRSIVLCSCTASRTSASWYLSTDRLRQQIGCVSVISIGANARRDSVPELDYFNVKMDDNGTNGAMSQTGQKGATLVE